MNNETNTTTNKTALQTANELLASNSTQRSWDIACSHIGLNPAVSASLSPLPCHQTTSPLRFWMAVAQWIALDAKRNMQKANWNTATSEQAPLSELRS